MSPKDTQGLGKTLGKKLKGNSVIFLEGDLGTGKTTFTRGMAEGLGIRVDASEVVSPTFVLMHEYPCRVPLYHADLYRLDRLEGEDLELLEECLQAPAVTVVEWGERAKNLYPQAYLRIKFKHEGLDKRRIRIEKIGKFLWRK